MEFVDSVLGLNGMSGVGAPVGPDHHTCLCGQRVGDLPLTFVAPLTADDDGNCHADPPVRHSQWSASETSRTIDYYNTCPG